MFQILKEQVGNSIENKKVDNAESAELQANSDTSSAMFTISRIHSNPGSSSFSSRNLSLSAPLNDSDDKTDFGGFDKLANSTKLAFSYTRWKAPNLNYEFEPSQALYDEICAEVNAGYRRSDDFDNANPELDTCVDLGLIKDYIPDKYAEYESLWWDQKGFITSFGIEGAVGDQDFDYINPADLEKKSKSDTSWSLKLHYSIVPVSWENKTLFTLSAEYQDSKKDSDSGTLCPVADEETQIATCVTGALGKPVSDDAKSLAVEIRRSYGDKAVALELKRDFEEDVTIVDLPLYFIRNKDKGLSGGLRIGWRDDTKDTSVGIFIGSTFSIF